MTALDIPAILSRYGATLSPDGFIQRCDKSTHTGVKPVIVKNRLRFEADGDLIMSGAVSGHTVETFVEKYWFWGKQPLSAKEIA